MVVWDYAGLLDVQAARDHQRTELKVDLRLLLGRHARRQGELPSSPFRTGRLEGLLKGVIFAGACAMRRQQTSAPAAHEIPTGQTGQM